MGKQRGYPYTSGSGDNEGVTNSVKSLCLSMEVVSDGPSAVSHKYISSSYKEWGRRPAA